MYDEHSIALINSAPQFGNINFEKLPKEFTSIYAEIVAIRLRMNEEQAIDVEDLKSNLKKLSKISHTYESYVILKYEEEDITAAAYISASAHSLSYQIKSLIDNEPLNPENILTPQGVNSLLAASILYFISGYTADAIEIIKKLPDIISNTNTSRLIIALKQLLEGKIYDINTNLPNYELSNYSVESISDLLLVKIY